MEILSKIFRIYRDVRFSNDKTLYKVRFCCSPIDLRTTFRLHGRGPVGRVRMPLITSTFNPEIAPLSRRAPPMWRVNDRGGKWHPDAGHLARIRHTIDRRPQKFKKPFLQPRFKKLFGGLDALLTTEDRLKTAPKVTNARSRADDRGIRRIIRILNC